MLKAANFFSNFKSQRGSSAMIIICTTFVVFIAAALITDISYAAIQSYKLAKGAREIARLGAAELTKSRAASEKVMREYSAKAVDGLNKLDIRISDTNKEITIVLEKPFEYIFLKYFGISKKNLNYSVTVKLSGIADYKGIRPFAISKGKLEYNKVVYLTNLNSNKADTIVFKEVNLGHDYETGILYGLRKSLRTGNGIYPCQDVNSMKTVSCISELIDKCKHQPACTYDNYKVDCSRVIVLPVVKRLETDSSKTMTIEGFSAFFVESVEMQNQSPVIKGRFIKYIIDTRVNDAAPDYGLLGLELIN